MPGKLRTLQILLHTHWRGDVEIAHASKMLRHGDGKKSILGWINGELR